MDEEGAMEWRHAFVPDECNLGHTLVTDDPYGLISEGAEFDCPTCGSKELAITGPCMCEEERDGDPED